MKASQYAASQWLGLFHLDLTTKHTENLPVYIVATTRIQYISDAICHP